MIHCRAIEEVKIHIQFELMLGPNATHVVPVARCSMYGASPCHYQLAPPIPLPPPPIPLPASLPLFGTSLGILGLLGVAQKAMARSVSRVVFGEADSSFALLRRTSHSCPPVCGSVRWTPFQPGTGPFPWRIQTDARQQVCPRYPSLRGPHRSLGRSNLYGTRTSSSCRR